jgi:outer membrane protein TolC
MKCPACVLCLALLFSGPAFCQTATNSLPSPPAEGGDELVLTPEMFAKLVAEKNAAVQTDQYEVRITANKLNGEKGQYEPLAFASVRREGRHRLNTVEEQIVSSNLPFLTEKVYTREAGIKGLVSTGANYKFAYNVEERSNNVIASQTLGLLNTEFTSTIGITVQQPLSRDFGKEATEVDRNVADIEHKIAIAQYKIQLYKTLLEAFGTYWETDKLLQTLELRKESLEDAKTLAKHAADRILAGKLPPSSQIEINSLVLNRNIEYERVKQSVLEKKIRLLTFMSMADIASRTINLQPDNPSSPAPPRQPNTEQPDFEENLAKWPAYAIEVLRQNESKIKQRYAENQMKPALNLTFSANGTGFSYSQHEALSLSHGRQYPDWYIGFEFEQPIFGNQKAKSQYLAQSDKVTEGEIAMNNERATYQNALEVTSAELSVAISAEKQSTQEVALRQQLYENEQQRFLLGNTILSTVLQKSSDLIDSKARQLETRANLEYSKFLYKYYHNTVLDSYHITVNE